MTFSLLNYASPISEQETVKKRYYMDNGLLNNFLYKGGTKLLENLCAIHLLKKILKDVIQIKPKSRKSSSQFQQSPSRFSFSSSSFKNSSSTFRKS